MPRPCPKASWRLSCPGSAQSAFVLLWSGGVIVGAADVAVDGRWDRGGGIVLRRAGGRSRPPSPTVHYRVWTRGCASVQSGASLLLSDQRIHDPGRGGSQNRRHPEQPELLKGPASYEEGGARAPRGVDGGVGHGDRDQVDQGQAEPDCDRRESCRSPSIRGAEDDDQEEERHHHFAHEPG